ncbi:transposase (plasmid) [Bradyrhizobium sp. CCGUVB1N3]|uniref:transposase n=1 Tax=Bradyrhizobium sp. CCGUVB1N3 TaxID=2949629 RepID=UPI0020B2830E|nr:transposase [Bradyrhizobium sp. CCGUVB1N3]MCP3477800.1 transposase [Bradyrhizobium sp. CCGUVB1N3]
MYRLIMAIRPDALPTDPAALTEMLALDVENEKLRVALNEMIFGKRSERLAVLVDEQLALELGDLEADATLPAPANDDVVLPLPIESIKASAVAEFAYNVDSELSISLI